MIESWLEDASRIHAAATPDTLWRYLAVNTHARAMPNTFEAMCAFLLATLPVKARIARGWTQSQLASALGIAEQQVQRYESTGYRSVSLARIGDVAAALDIDMSERAELRGPDAA